MFYDFLHPANDPDYISHRNCATNGLWRQSAMSDIISTIRKCI